MDKVKQLLNPLLVVLAVAPLIYLYVIAIQFGFYGEWREISPEILREFSLEMDDTTTSVTLPYVIEGGTPGQSVVLSTTLEHANAHRIYVKSVFSPLRIYANDILIYDYGQPGTYPSYFLDPPTMTATVELPNESPIDLRLEYHYPTTREDLILDTVMVGSYPAIFNTLLSHQEPFLFLYLVFLVMGVFFICIGLLIRIIERQGAFFVWLGLIALCCSLWGLGEYDPTGLFIHNAGLISLVTFSSVFFLPVAVHGFFRSAVRYHNSYPMTVCIRLCILMFAAANLLQATSYISYYNALLVFRWLAVFSFIFGIGYTVYEWRAYENQLAKWFLLPWCIVILATLVEGIRFVMGNIYVYGQFVQFALVLFIIINSIIGAALIQKAFALRELNRHMEHEYKLMEVQVLNQQRYNHLLMETRQALRQQHHDLHHQLAVVRHLAEEGALNQLNLHLDSVVNHIPEELEIYCENMAVNAVTAHYVAKARAMGVSVTIQLAVPEVSECIGDNSLCVIFGNILENAVEACGRMSDKNQLITLTSHIRNGMLVIAQKNSYEGQIHRQGDQFYSSKRSEFGVGLSSVEAVARKHGGNATFTSDGRLFHSSVYVRI